MRKLPKRGPKFEDLFKRTLGAFPSRDPIGIHARAWCYEERRGLNVIAELRDKDGNYIGTTQTLVPWRTIVTSVNRYDKRKAAEGGR